MKSIFTFSLFIVLIHSSFASADNCLKKLNPKTSQLAHKYMQKNKLIMEGDEQHFPDLGIETRWDILKVVSAPRGCLVVMAICDFIKNKKTCGENAYEVLGLISGQKARADQIVDFYKIIPTPKKVVAKIGTTEESEPAYYYVQLEGDSARNAIKSIETQTPYGGFSGTAVRGQKAPYDPTAKRDWQVVNGKYSLRRGATAEVLDIQSWQLDGLDESGADAYWGGCEKPNGQDGKCLVAPWAQSYVLDLLPMKN